MEEKNIKEIIKKAIIPIAICLIIIFILIFILTRNQEKNNYEIEEVKDFSYFKLYENEKYGIIDTAGNVLVPAKYAMIEIPNPSKDVFIGYLNYGSAKTNYETEVVNSKNEKILTNYSRSPSTYV